MCAWQSFFILIFYFFYALILSLKSADLKKKKHVTVYFSVFVLVYCDILICVFCVCVHVFIVHAGISRIYYVCI